MHKMYYRKVVVIRVWIQNSLFVSCMHAALTKTIDISNSRVVVRQVECPYTTFSFRVVYVSTHKITYGKETVMHVWSHNLPILAHMQLQPIKVRSLTVEHSFGVQITRTLHIVFELCVKEKERKKNKTEICTFDFLKCEAD